MPGAQELPKDDDFPSLTDIIRNRAVSMQFFALDASGEAIYEADGSPRIETWWLKLTANELAELESHYDGYEVPLTVDELAEGKDQNGDPLSEFVTRHVRDADGRVLMRRCIGLEGFQEALGRRKYDTIRQVLSIAFRHTPEEMGARMLPSLAADYEMVVSTAWAIAMGINPDIMGKALAQARAETKEAIEILNNTTEEEVSSHEPSSPGPATPPSGRARKPRAKAASAGASKSSGA